MRRSWQARTFSVVWTFWFLLLATVPMGMLSHCPMHGGGAAMQRMESMLVSERTHAPSIDQPAECHCTCVGSCGCGCAALFAAPAAESIVLPATGTIATEDAGLSSTSHLLAESLYFLPYSNGPPRA